MIGSRIPAPLTKLVEIDPPSSISGPAYRPRRVDFHKESLGRFAGQRRKDQSDRGILDVSHKCHHSGEPAFTRAHLRLLLGGCTQVRSAACSTPQHANTTFFLQDYFQQATYFDAWSHACFRRAPAWVPVPSPRRASNQGFKKAKNGNAWQRCAPCVCAACTPWDTPQHAHSTLALNI